MSKDIHKWTDGRYTLMFDEHTFFVFDNDKEERMTALEVTKKLNEQQATINKLQELVAEFGATLLMNGFEIEIDGKDLNELIKDE